MTAIDQVVLGNGHSPVIKESCQTSIVIKESCQTEKAKFLALSLADRRRSCASCFQSCAAATTFRERDRFSWNVPISQEAEGCRRSGEVRDGARDLSPRIAATAGLILPHFYVDFIHTHVLRL